MASETSKESDDPIFTINLTDLFGTESNNLEEIDETEVPDVVLQQIVEQNKVEVPKSGETKVGEIPNAKVDAKRFEALTNEEIDEIAANTVGKRTKKQTKWGVLVLRERNSYFDAMYTSRVSSVAANRSAPGSRRAAALLNLSKRSANTSLNRSLQSSHIFEETGNHVIEGFGVPLPVLVAETLTLSDRSTVTSAKLSENGWAWLVSGRRLFIWKYKSIAGARINTSHCRELTLPSSDLAHKAELVCVLMPDSNASTMTQPSAIAVTPEGLVRYWPSIAHEGSYLEASADLHGQECFTITDVHPLGCILATTTSSLILLTMRNVSGHNNILCHNLKMPQGMLAGISRRVSSFIFGSIPNQTTESKLSRVLAVDGEEPCDKILYVLFGPNLQKWNLIDQDPEQFIYECDLDKMVRENFLAVVWGQDVSHGNDLKTWMIDMQQTRKGVIVLVAAVNSGMSQLIRFALVTLDMSGDVAPVTFMHFNILKYSEIYKENEDVIQKYNLVIPSIGSQVMYIYAHNMILCVTSDDEEPDKIELRSQTDRILGSGCYSKLPLFFINTKGIVSLVPSSQQFGADISMSFNETIPIETADLDASIALNISNALPDRSNVAQEDDKTALLKSALIHFIKKELKQCEDLISEHFACSELDVDTVLDSAVCCLSQNMIDDYPASDPRWAESYSEKKGSKTSSLIIKCHLEEKQKASKYLMMFLRGTGLLDRLQFITIGKKTVETRAILFEHTEKLVVALALQNVHSSVSTVLDAAIKSILETRPYASNQKLTARDHFYRQVSCIEDIFPTLVEKLTVTVTSDVPIQEITNQVSTVNKIFIDIMQSVLKFRQMSWTDESSLYEPPGEHRLPVTSWTNSEGSCGIRSLLIKLYLITSEHGVKGADDVQTRGLLLQQMVDLCDIILDGYVSQIQSMPSDSTEYVQLQSRYNKHKFELIQCLLDVNQPERAAALAEKYCEFRILVKLCEENDNQERLQRYMKQFAKEGFTDFVFKWYLDEGKRGKLLQQPFMHSDDLKRFLEIHPTLSWVHHFQTLDFSSAHKTLQYLANNEIDLLSRKKTLLSLSKLSALLADNSEQEIESAVEDIDQQQDLVLHQETLPAPVLEVLGMNAEDMRVLSPRELIKMFVCEDNTSASELDFKKALDLLQYIPETQGDFEEGEEVEDANGLRHHIFCCTILRNNWENMDTDSPLESLKSTIFFRTIALAINSGMDLNEFLPPIHSLLARPELADLAEDSSFKFLIQAGYEHVAQLFM